MLTLLAALILSGPPAARAEEPPAGVDATDTDGDGTISGKERRTARRAARRARRAERGESPQSDAEMDAADAAESSARGAAASGKAASAAAALKSSLPSADAGGAIPDAATAGSAASIGRTSDVMTSASAGGSKSAPAGDAKNLPTGNPGNPKAPSDFALAARSGYAPAFAAAGLKIGPDGKSVLRLDGKPATPEDYARLQREIASMPAALGRRPDFFSIVSPAHYADLKRGYREKKDDPVYKDVGTTAEDRDFVHTASCTKLSGDCNKNVEKASYKKGDFVAPEDLDNIWDALQKELDGSAEKGGTPSPGAARADLAREKAMDAARALSDGGAGDKDAIKSATREGPAAEKTPVSKAVASVRRFWKNATALALPGTAGAKEGDETPLLPIGALALAAIIGGALFMRRRG